MPIPDGINANVIGAAGIGHYVDLWELCLERTTS